MSQRRGSRTEQFFAALESGHVRDAVNSLRSRSRGGGGRDEGGRHTSTPGPTRPRGRRGSHVDDYDSSDYDSEYDTDYDDDEHPRGRTRGRRSAGYNRSYYDAAAADEGYYTDSRRYPPRAGGGGGGRGRGRPRSSFVRSPTTASSSSGRRRSSSAGAGGGGPDWTQAAKAAVTAGLIEASRAKRDTRERRLTRAFTAAAGAAAVDVLLVDRQGGDGPDRKSKRHVVQSTLAGLALDRLAHGKRKK